MTKLEMLFIVGFALLFTAFYTLPLFARLIGKRWDRTLPLKCPALALSIAFGASLCEGQTNAPVVTTPPSVGSTLQSWATEGITNSYWVPYGIYAPGLNHRYGWGIAAQYPISQYILAGPRLDYVDGNFWMPSGNATLQLPIKVTSFLTITPMTYAGVGVPLSGAQIGNFTVPGSKPKDNDGNATAILGAGLSIHLYTGTGWFKDAGLIGDVESWSNFPKQQYRLGVALHF